MEITENNQIKTQVGSSKKNEVSSACSRKIAAVVWVIFSCAVIGVGIAGVGGNYGWWQPITQATLPNSFAAIGVGVVCLLAIPLILGLSKCAKKKEDLGATHLMLKEKITNHKASKPTEDQTQISVYTHVHKICDHLYLGNYRAYLSVDPKFLESHQDQVAAPIEDVFGDQPTEQQRDLYKLIEKGSSELQIKKVISVTQFSPGDKVPPNDWSRFEPDLTKLKVDRIQINVDDDKFAWELIEPQLDSIFPHIDDAFLQKQNILIHCVQGASRSACVVFAYLMNRCGVTLDQAFSYVQSIRPQVELKKEIKEGLIAYEEELKKKRA